MNIHSVSVYDTVESIPGIFTLQYKFHYLQLNNGLAVSLALYKIHYLQLNNGLAVSLALYKINT